MYTDDRSLTINSAAPQFARATSEVIIRVHYAVYCPVRIRLWGLFPQYTKANMYDGSVVIYATKGLFSLALVNPANCRLVIVFDDVIGVGEKGELGERSGRNKTGEKEENK